MEKLVKTHEMRETRLGRLAFHKGEGRLRLGLRQVALIIANWRSLGRRPLTLFLSPFARREATKRTRVGMCDARFLAMT